MQCWRTVNPNSKHDDDDDADDDGDDGGDGDVLVYSCPAVRSCSALFVSRLSSVRTSSGHGEHPTLRRTIGRLIAQSVDASIQ